MAKFEEAKIQEAIVNRFNELVFYRQLNQLCFLYSNRNENKGIATGAIYKRMGRKAGIPDLTLVYGKGCIAYIEVKTPSTHKTKKGVETKSKGMSEDQIDFYNEYIEPMQIPFAVCSSINDFENFVWFLKKRAGNL